MIGTNYQNTSNIVSLINRMSLSLEQRSIVNEAVKSEKHLEINPLNVDRFVKANNVPEITDPIFFIKDGVPSPNGLLSNELFGVTKEERANTFGYIDLHGWFMHPLAYKIWSRMDGRIKNIVHGVKKYSINEQGDFVEDEHGKSGIKFLKDNMDKIRIKSTESKKRDKNIQFIMKYKDVIFMNKMIVIPPYYRDVNTSGGNVGVGILNKYYSSLIVSVRSLVETADYGISMSDAVNGRIQETILQIYDCICGTSGAETDGVGLSKKKGLVRTAVMSKTSDYGSRLVISSPELKAERLEDIMVDLDHCAIPLASVCVNFKPFVVFAVKRFFENEFGGGVKHKVMDKNGNISYEEVKDPLVTFSEEKINEEIKKFVYGYSNRLAPVEVPLVNGKTSYMIFKGHNTTAEDVAKGNVAGESSLINRRLTWCDVLYMAASEAVKNKAVLIVRFPIDSSYSQTPMKVRVSTVKNMEKVYINGEYYPFYPKIREEDIGTNTSNMFIDTLQFSNLFLKGFCGDYDGDQVSAKAAYTVEANEELIKYMDSKANFINSGGTNIRVSSNEAIMSIYSLTKVLPETVNKLTKNIQLG